MASSRLPVPQRTGPGRASDSRHRVRQAALGWLRTLYRESRGVMMVEAVVAVSVFALVGTAVLAGVSTAYLSGSRVETHSLAENIARNQMEYAFIQVYHEPGWESYATLDVPDGYSVAATADFAQRDCDYDIAKVRVEVHRDGDKVLAVETLRARTDGLGLRVSNNSDRSGSQPLGCVTLTGDVYVFVEDENELADRVRFWLNGNGPVEVDHEPPWNFKETNTNDVLPWDTTSLMSGEHVITARVRQVSSGNEVYVSARFTIDN